VLLVHIDKHQAIVSRHGTAAGSRVFHTTVQFLRAAVRDMDVVARYEDTTFALMLPGAGLANAVGVAERLRQAITRCMLPVVGGRVQFTVSIGGAEAMRGDDTRRLLERAREAVDAAVQSGGNCCYFHNGQWSETIGATMEKVDTR
jgi:diguanylate cyclase